MMYFLVNRCAIIFHISEGFMKIRDLIEATGAEVLAGNADYEKEVTISTDTRTIKEGDFYEYSTTCSHYFRWKWQMGKEKRNAS